ncbi:hypothetical protein ACFQ61_21000 [Streptomyces sp. NPDC056500]|uniref:hypothetical protein n=1 Tax=Streptomyces sp. NPDC056500 TaxID=3345840 RepID=UPI0036C17C9D
MKRKLAAAGTVVASLVLTAAMASPAAAITVYRQCFTTGADGGARVMNWHGPDRVDLTLSVTDSRADGHHVRVRFLSKTVSGTTVKWGWHKNTSGAGRTFVRETSASHPNGIFNVGVEIARFEGNTYLNSCVDWG